MRQLMAMTYHHLLDFGIYLADIGAFQLVQYFLTNIVRYHIEGIVVFARYSLFEWIGRTSICMNADIVQTADDISCLVIFTLMGHGKVLLPN